MPQKRSRWSQLPSDLLQTIADNLTDIADLFHFRSVCSPWRSAAISLNLPPQLPWLLFPPNPYADPNDPRHFFTLSKNTVFPLPLPSQTLTLGSSDGWILTARPVSLLNPLTRSRIHLPPLPEPFRSEISRAKLCKAPCSSSYVVMASFFCSSTLACFESGGTDWKYIVADFDLGAGDFAFYKGCFFVFRNDGAVSIIRPSSLEKVSVIPSLEMISFYHRYLVESSTGDLLLIVKPSTFGGKKFRVFRLEGWILTTPKWVEVMSIGDDIVFVDDEHAMCFCAGDFSGFRKNCIYYTDVYRVCLYNIQGGRIEQLPCYWENFPYPKELQQASWFLPRIC